MDDLIGGLVGSVFGIAILVVLGAAIGAGWLIYKFCELVLPPLFRELGQGCGEIQRGLETWWREMTWKRELERAQRQTLQQIDAAREEHVQRCAQLVAMVEQQETLTAGRAAAVQVTVEVAA